MDTWISCDLFIFKKCLVSVYEVILGNKNNPQNSNFQTHTAVWQLMNETLHRCLCTFIIYYTTLRNKTTANDKLMLSQLCTLRNDIFYQGSASLTTKFALGRQAGRRIQRTPIISGRVSNGSDSAFIKFVL